MVGQKEKEEELAWILLEIVHLCPTNTRVRVEEEDAADGGGNASWRTRKLADQDY